MNREMDMEYSNTMMVLYMKATGKIILNMELVNINERMAMNFLDIGKIILCMEMVL